MDFNLCADCGHPTPWIAIFAACSFAVAFFALGQRFRKRRAGIDPVIFYALSAFAVVVAWRMF
jgi:hypothetical protein